MAEQQAGVPQPTSDNSEPTKTPPTTASDTSRAEKAPTSLSLQKEVIEKLKQSLPFISDADKAVAQAVEALIKQANDPVRANQRGFQHDLAYVFQDSERARGTHIPLSAEARAEVTRLAGSAPGLESERMKDLLRATTTIEDRGLVREIRRTGAEIGQQADQNTQTIRSQIDVLESRARLAPRPDGAAEPVGPAQTGRSAQGQPDRTEAAAPGETARRQDGAIRQNQDRPILVQGAGGGTAMGTFFRALRATGPTDTPPWEPAAQPFGQRLSAFEDKMQQGRDDISLRGVEKSGRAALEALEGFRNGEAAVVLNRIREAARTDPGGMAGVLSEMREGGRFADLRQQFNNALSDEKGVTAAYDKAASALARYGQDRIVAEQIGARRPDAANLSAKFEAMDKEIGTAAGEVPSRRDGKNMLEDLSKRIAELLQKAVDSVKNMFPRGPSAGSSPSGPSPV